MQPGKVSASLEPSNVKKHLHIILLLFCRTSRIVRLTAVFMEANVLTWSMITDVNAGLAIRFITLQSVMQYYINISILQGRNCEEDVDECAEHPCKVILLRNYLYLFIFDIL